MRQPGRFNTSELIEFTLLSLVNRHLGEVSHLKTLPLLHPETRCEVQVASSVANGSQLRQSVSGCSSGSVFKWETSPR